MLGYSLRIAGVLVREHLRPRHGVGDVVEARYRAWPWYCDLNRHVNNAHFLTFLEYGRWGWVLRTGMGRLIRREGITFLIAGISIIYRRPLPLWRGLNVRTQLAAADDAWLYMTQQIFDHQGRPAARALVRVDLRDSAGKRSPAQLLAGHFQSPALTPELQRWLESMREGLTHMKAAP